MQITLNTDVSPMWFLGEPKSLVVSLNYLEPGPVELDFEKLEESQQKQLLLALKGGTIMSDMTYDALYQVWLKSRPAVEEVVEDPQAQLRLAMARQIQDRVERRKQAQVDKEAKFQERCNYLSQQSVKALKATITKENDERILNALLRIEEQGKQRTMVVRRLHEKLRQIESKRAKEIEKETLRQIEANAQVKKTSPLSVVESEMTTVTLSPEELIKAVTGTGGV